MRPIIQCKDCGKSKEHKGRGLCNACYSKHWRTMNLERKRQSSREYARKKREKKGYKFKGQHIKEICSVCSGEFEKKVWNQKYCSTKCLNYYHNRTEKRKKSTERYVKTDKAKERYKRYRTKNYSKVLKREEEYRIKSGRSKTTFREGMINKCEVCGKEFQPTKFVPYRKYCSDKCSSKARATKYRERHPERMREAYEKYYNSEKGRFNILKKNIRKRTRLNKHVNNFLSYKQFQRILRRDVLCVYCGSDNEPKLDHIIPIHPISPISKEGDSSYNNFVVAYGPCNRSKSNKNVKTWCKEQGIEVPNIVKELLKKQKSQKRVSSYIKNS